jgi:DNA polymerase III epsilon subunit-like protein
MKILFFDTETTGLFPKYWTENDLKYCPRLIQLGFSAYDNRNQIAEFGTIVLPHTSFEVEEGAFKAHGISKAKVLSEGASLTQVLLDFEKWVNWADMVICHNTDFDFPLVGCEFLRLKLPDPLSSRKQFCTMKHSTDIVRIPSMYPRYGKYKYPTLQELHKYLFREGFSGAHDAISDIRATVRCYFEMLDRGLIKH